MNFQTPGWLALLILLPLLGVVAVVAVRMRRGQWTSFVAPRLRGVLLKRTTALPRWLALVFLLLACAAVIVALARPRADAGTRVEKTIGRNVMIALDISKSMRVDDVKPDRLTQAKVLIYELLEAMPNERIGMIGFAGNAYVYAPLTIDHSAVREIVEQIDENWAPLGGSDIGSAVELAIDRLKKTGQQNNALVILSDGEENTGDYEDMISEAERAGVSIVAIGIGTEDGGFVPNPDFPNGRMMDRAGRAVVSQVQTDVLRKLAEGTHGRFTLAGSGSDVSDLVKSVVKDLDAFEMDGRERRVSIEFYQWLMLPAIVFLMASIALATRWKGVRLALLVAGLPMISPQAKANEADEAKAALAGENYEQARDSYRRLAEKSRLDERKARYRLGEATASYRAGEFRDARTAYSQAMFSENDKVRATAHIGMGNSLFQLGWKGLMDESYPASGSETPDLDRFDATVKEQLDKLRGGEVPDDGELGGYELFESLITNWTDAVRHYESARKLTPGDPIPSRDRDMTMAYLERLKELLKEEEDQAEQSMPQEQPGEGQPQEGEGDQDGEPQEGEGGEPSDQDGMGGEGEEDRKGKGGQKEKEEPEEKDGSGDEDGDEEEGKDPNESKEERARRILEENADVEKGPLSPGRREFRDAEKDW